MSHGQEHRFVSREGHLACPEPAEGYPDCHAFAQRAEVASNFRPYKRQGTTHGKTTDYLVLSSSESAFSRWRWARSQPVSASAWAWRRA